MLEDKKQVFWAAGAFALVIALTFSFQNFNTSKTKKYPVAAQFSGEGAENITVGISQEENSVDFGVLPPGTIDARKKILVSNNGDSSIQVKLNGHGNITRYLNIRNRSFELSPDETRAVDIFLEGKSVNGTKYLSGWIEIKKRTVWW